LTHKLWDIALDLWEHRNEVLHKRENEVSGDQERKLNRKVMEVLNNLNRRAMPQKDRHIFVAMGTLTQGFLVQGCMAS
jgi:hypothetical protein